MNNIEAEILELSQKIAEKRHQLEASKGVIEEHSLDSARDKELVKTVVGEKISSTVPPSSVSVATSSSGAGVKVASDKSYLDYLDEESRATVEGLVESIFTKGLTKTLEELPMQEPFIIDALHDVLTDKIYNELKKKGLL